MKSPLSLFSNASVRPAAVASSLALALAVTGCGMASNSSLTKTAAGADPGVVTISGQVHGGQQGVAGATIQLYSVGTPATGSGYGVGATALLTSTVKTDQFGSFSITGKYTCPTPATSLYIVATGGNAGTSTNNSGIAMMTALGACPAGGNLLASLPSIAINEVTTVAAVWALQQFMAAPATVNVGMPNIGAPTTAYATGTTVGSVQSGVIGLTNAFTTAKVMADITTGVSPNANYAYATPEFAKINTVADILSSCINSDTSSSTTCSDLYAAATPTGSTVAADTIQVAYYIAQNPINNVSNLFTNFVTGTPPFTALTTAPKDFTIAINYAPQSAGTNAIVNGVGVAFDTFGNAWIANNTGNSVVELGVDGSAIMAPVTAFTASLTGGSAPLFAVAQPAAARTFTAPKYPAVDLLNQAWIPNYESATGGIVTGTTAAPTGDVAVFNGSTAAGAAGTGGGSVKTGYFVGPYPYSLAIDQNNNVLVANSGSASASPAFASVSKMANDGTGFTYSTQPAINATGTAFPNRISGGSTGALSLIALDNNTNISPTGAVWVDNSQGCSIIGKYGLNATKWGTINQFNESSLVTLSGSQVVSAASNATVGAGSTTNCGSTSNYVGQVVNATMANIAGIAVDRNNNVYTQSEDTSSTGFDGASILVAPTATTGLVPTSFTVVDVNTTPPTPGVAPTVSGTTLRKGNVLAVDGNNNIWATSLSLGSVAEFNINPVTGAATFFTPGKNTDTTAGASVGFVHAISNSTLAGIAIDPSGNVWVTNQNSATGVYTNQAGVSTSDSTSVTVIVGAAGPVITPAALALKVNKLGTKP